MLLSSWFGTLVFPAVCVLPFEKRLRAPFAIYALIVVGSVLLTLILALLADSMSEEGFLWVFSWLPATHVVIAETGLAGDDAVLVGSIIWNSLLVFALFIGAMMKQPEIARAEKHAIAGSVPEAPPAAAAAPTE